MEKLKVQEIDVSLDLFPSLLYSSEHSPICCLANTSERAGNVILNQHTTKVRFVRVIKDLQTVFLENHKCDGQNTAKLQ